ncbi:hypothetical protein L1987_14997 [Smallanthus sonchifolius]|uniref:Uncharacterized protein n=1 Tax=Smallanthus sonchifolius TaxID=185202 RepID=A0ACB9J4D8_9ASTR|nr:hypothetical protein L1987_14997 [Smallanthus sonchifolius]
MLKIALSVLSENCGGFESSGKHQKWQKVQQVQESQDDPIQPQQEPKNVNITSPLPQQEQVNDDVQDNLKEMMDALNKGKYLLPATSSQPDSSAHSDDKDAKFVVLKPNLQEQVEDVTEPEVSKLEFPVTVPAPKATPEDEIPKI